MAAYKKTCFFASSCGILDLVPSTYSFLIHVSYVLPQLFTCSTTNFSSLEGSYAIFIQPIKQFNTQLALHGAQPGQSR